MAVANLPGVKLWYEDTGNDGIPIVCMHAATGSSRVWEYQIPAFTAAGYRLIAYDRRGWGRTVPDPETGPQPGYAVDDLNALMDHLGVGRFHLLGTAAGGSPSVDYALTYPERLRSLLVCNSIGGVQDEDYLELGLRLRPAPFDQMPPDFRELSGSYRATNPEGVQRWLDLEHLSRPEGAQAPRQLPRNHITFTSLETIRVPTLLLTGDADLWLPPAVLRMFAVRIPDSEYVIVSECGHSTYWEQPELFNRTVLDFIGKH